MKILVVSDTHGNNTNLRKAVANMGENLDLMVHLGDFMCHPDVIREIAGCPVEIVKGNCDSFTGIQPARLIDEGYCQGEWGRNSYVWAYT